MFAKLSDTIARSFVAHGTISEDRFAVCRYGIGQTFSILLNLVTTLCIGIAFGMIGESLLFLAAYIPLRSYAGGFHAATPMRCSLVLSVETQAAVLAILRFASVTLGVSVLIYTISGILLWCLAPTADRNKPLDELEKGLSAADTDSLVCGEHSDDRSILSAAGTGREQHPFVHGGAKRAAGCRKGKRKNML